MADSEDDAAHGDCAERGRRERARASITAQPAGDATGVAESLQRLCRALVEQLPAMGSAVNLMSVHGGGRVTSDGVVAGSDDRMVRIDDVQFTTGEGPCHDAFATRHPVLTPDLGGDAGERWPGYTPVAVAAGVAASFAFPLYVGAAGFGVLDVYADRPGALTDEQLAMSLTFAELATAVLLEGTASGTGGGLDAGLEDALGYRSEIYQAQGMVMVQLGVSLADALVRLRAQAFANDQDLADLAREVVTGRTRLDRDR